MSSNNVIAHHPHFSVPAVGNPGPEPAPGAFAVANAIGAVVMDMMHFVHRGTYPLRPDLNGITNQHVDMFAIAVKYGIDSLEDHALQNYQAYIHGCCTRDFSFTLLPVYIINLTESCLRDAARSQLMRRCETIVAPGSAENVFCLWLAGLLPLFASDWALAHRLAR
ncbi:MAG: hypothetical protein Q9166_003709 [cf. Caloplaca sp. 2 TL-2023]